MKNMPVSYQRILLRLERKEARLLRGEAPPEKADGKSRFEQKIPPEVHRTLENAFFRAFQTLFAQ